MNENNCNVVLHYKIEQTSIYESECILMFTHPLQVFSPDVYNRVIVEWTCICVPTVYQYRGSSDKIVANRPDVLG